MSTPSICASVLTRLVETRTHDEPNKRLAVMLHYLVLLSISRISELFFIEYSIYLITSILSSNYNPVRKKI